MRVTMLGGGIGASRVAVPLADALGPGELTLVVNTGDDLWRHGLRICPDLDTNLYALSGLSDRRRGWGIRGDTFDTMAQLGRLGVDTWFRLGDLDLATHLARTEMLAAGEPLSAVMAHFAAALGVATRLLPATDDEVATRVLTPYGEFGFQEYFVQRAASDEVVAVRYEGASGAAPAPGVLEAINDADVVVIAPSNPVASLGPILAIPGVFDALAARRANEHTTVAVTPVVSGIAIVDEGEARRARCRDAMLASLGREHRAHVIARHYAGLADVFVLDRADVVQAALVERCGMRVVTADTVLDSAARAAALATALLTGVG